MDIPLGQVLMVGIKQDILRGEIQTTIKIRVKKRGWTSVGRLCEMKGENPWWGELRDTHFSRESDGAYQGFFIWVYCGQRCCLFMLLLGVCFICSIENRVGLLISQKHTHTRVRMFESSEGKMGNKFLDLIFLKKLTQQPKENKK